MNRNRIVVIVFRSLLVAIAAYGGYLLLVNARLGTVMGKNFGTMFSIERVAIALEHYRAAHGAYPVAGTASELRAALGPRDVKDQDWTDRWEHPLVAEATPEGYLLSSPGGDGMGGHEFGGPVSRPGHSITLRNGVFVQYNVRAEKAARDVEARIAAVRKPAAGN